MSYSVAQNTSFLTIASVAQKIISGVYFFIVSWFIAEGKTEAYFAVFAAIAVFTVIADFGLGNTFTRQISEEPEKTAHYLQVVFIAKLLLGSGAVLLLITTAFFFRYPSENIYLVMIAGATLFCDSLRNIFYGVLRARNNLKYEALGTVAAQGVALMIGTIALFIHAELIWLVIPFLIASILHTTYAMWCMYRKTHLSFSWVWDPGVIRMFILLSLPFALTGLFAQLYSYQDSFLIKQFLPSLDGDNWARAYKAASVFQFIPTSLTANLYPRITVLHLRKNVALQKLLLGSYRYVLIIAIPLAFGTAAFINPLVARFAHRFTAASPILEILIFTVIFNFVNSIHLTTLNATRRQTLQTILMGLTLLFSVVVNSFAIPRYGTLGAALVAVASSMLLSVSGYIFTQKTSNFSHASFIKIILQLLIPGIAMYVIGKYFVVHNMVLIGMVLSSLGYLIGIIISGGLQLSEIKHSWYKLYRAPREG